MGLRGSGRFISVMATCVSYWFLQRNEHLTRCCPLVHTHFVLSMSVKGDDSKAILATELPSVEVAWKWHIGLYKDVGDAYCAITNYLRKEGRSIGTVVFEEYESSFQEEPDESKHRTRVYMEVGSGGGSYCAVM